MAGSDRAPVSVRLPKSEAKGDRPLLNADGFAVLNRDTLLELFEHDPESVKRLGPLVDPEVEPDLESDVEVK